MIERDPQRLSVARQCDLLGLARSTLYYAPVEDDPEDLALMRLLDEQYTRRPFYGVRRMTRWLRGEGHSVNPKHVRRLLCAGQPRFCSPFVRPRGGARRRVSVDCGRPTGMGANTGGANHGSRPNQPPKEVVNRHVGGYHKCGQGNRLCRQTKGTKSGGPAQWLCYSANFSPGWNGAKLEVDPPGGRYGLCLHEFKLLKP